MQSQDERDAEGFAARRERESTPVVPVNEGEEITGKYADEELAEFRARRPVDERVSRLERKQDQLRGELKGEIKDVRNEMREGMKDVRSDVKQLSSHVTKLSSDVAGAVGKIDGQEGVLSEMLSLVKKTADRDHVTFTAKVEIDKEKELAKVEVDKEKELAVIAVTKEEQVDVVKAKSDRRKEKLKILGFLASGGGLIELLHRLGVL